MNRFPSTALALVTFAFHPMLSANEIPKPDYPPTKKVDVTDDYHGTKIADPYRWLEDDNAEDTKAWVKAQNAVTFRYLESIPQRAKIRDRLTELWNYERFGMPFPLLSQVLH